MYTMYRDGDLVASDESTITITSIGILDEFGTLFAEWSDVGESVWYGFFTLYLPDTVTRNVSSK